MCYPAKNKQKPNQTNNRQIRSRRLVLRQGQNALTYTEDFTSPLHSLSELSNCQTYYSILFASVQVRNFF